MASLPASDPSDWVPGPPPPRGTGRASRWTDRLAAVQDRPGEWLSFKTQSAFHVARWLQEGRFAFPPGGGTWEVEPRNTNRVQRLFVRYTPPRSDPVGSRMRARRPL